LPLDEAFYWTRHHNAAVRIQATAARNMAAVASFSDLLDPVGCCSLSAFFITKRLPDLFSNRSSISKMLVTTGVAVNERDNRGRY
jgi:hypothetical protein